MSLRGAQFATWQSLVPRGGCFSKTCNDMEAKVNALPIPALFVGAGDVVE